MTDVLHFKNRYVVVTVQWN